MELAGKQMNPSKGSSQNSVFLIISCCEQRFGDGPEDELALESNGDYTREIGFLKFSNFNTVETKNETSLDNLLNNVWYQPEEIFPVDGTPEIRQRVFWIPVDRQYFSAAKKLEVPVCITPQPP